ncbi:MAG: glycogen synthase GlgA [Deltaproteobacteria bacterium]|nr:glycogen synthase GlgA [Deltaproteobacteria bacterium]
MQVLFASSEVVPFAKTGGLADVAGSMPQALKKLGCDVRLVLPLYRMVRQGNFPLQKRLEGLPVHLGGRALEVDIYESELGDGLPVYFVERDEFFDRSYLYGTPRGDYFDNDQRFTLFCKAALALSEQLSFQPDLFHGQDWQTGLIPALLHFLRRRDPFWAGTASLFTIHNIAYQGLVEPDILPLAGLPWEAYTPSGLEYYGAVSLLKSGIVYSQIINTVSRKYSQEIQTEEYGYGLEGILTYRQADLFGIVNGVDYETWNPKTDPLIAASYDPDQLQGKETCKADLLREFNLSPEQAAHPVLGVISRLADQKGFDLLAAVMDRLLQQELSLVVLGTGEEKYHQLFSELAAKHPRKIGLRLAYDNTLAHKIEAGSDMFLMPSRYEPCGLNQIYSLKYGTIPVVRATGGLDDTIVPFDRETKKGTGFKFHEYTADDFWLALSEALAVYRNADLWKTLMRNAMAVDYSWENSAREYVNLYRLARERLAKGR